MSVVQLMINKLTASYSSNCHFKIKIVVSSSQNKESVENKHSFKYQKGTSEVNMYEKLDLKTYTPLTSESKLHIFLEVYTKTGYKTAGVGKLNLSKGVMANFPIKIEIQKCPLGKGNVEIQFLNLNLPAKEVNKIKLPRKISKDNLSENSDISFLSSFTNNINQNDISFVSYATNLTNQVKNNNYNTNPNIYNNNTKANITNPYSSSSTNNIFKKNNDSNFNNSRSCNNIFANQNKTMNSNNVNNDILKDKERQISELKTKIDYYLEENNELKNLVNDFKKEKKTLNDEKNAIIQKQKEKIRAVTNEKDELEMKYLSACKNLNILQNNKNDSDEKFLNMKTQYDKQVSDLTRQIKNLNNVKMQLETQNRTKEEKIFELDRKIKEITVNYQKKFAQLKNDYSSEKNNNILNYNENLQSKEEEIAKLKIKINSQQENIKSLNELIELNERQNNEKEEMTENMQKLLEQISSKDKQIFDLKKEISDLNNKINTVENSIKTKKMLSDITEKELKNNINNLQNIINEKENQLVELRTKYDNIKYDSKRFHPKIHYIEDSDDEKNDDNNEMMLNQIKEIQKTYKEREEKLLKEKNDEIKKLRLKNSNLVRESYLENNNNIDIKKYVNEINRLKNVNKNLEKDLDYYKDLNNKFVNNEKRTTVYESENVKLQNLLQQKNEEIDIIMQKHKKLEEENRMLERQLVNSKGKLGEVLNELVEVETKCVSLEEEKKNFSKSYLNGSKYC